ncbi:unnamed protein product, partial [marine sediment metagenome]
GHNGSGDIFLAFSTANERGMKVSQKGRRSLDALANADLDPLFQAVVESVEEAVIDALIANEPMTGANNLTVPALPHDQVMELLKNAKVV